MTAPAQTGFPTARVYLRAVKPAFATPCPIANRRFLLSGIEEVEALGDDDKPALGDSDAVLDVFGVEARIAILPLQAVLTCFHLSSRCTVDVVGYWVEDIGFMRAPGPTLITWGHYTDSLDHAAVAFAERHHTTLEAVGMPEKFSRVSNAIRLYTESLHTQNADLALLGFVGSLESLFSIAPQELSFRLSLVLARFLGDSPSDQRTWFDRARELYVIRSKLAHGDKVADSEEGAAIQVVERWTPEAEEIARLSICRLLDFALVDLFNSKKRHEALLTNLLFIPTLKDAVSAVG